MNEHDIFLAALDIADPAARDAYLHGACAADPTLRGQVEALLVAHSRSGEFLDVPALQQIAGKEQSSPGNETRAEPSSSEEGIVLSFLEPSGKPGSIGRLKHFEILEVLGRGGCGIVLKAFDEMLHRVVAIKVMAPSLAATSPARKRFLREARAAAGVHHENVIGIHAVEEQPIPFLVMEYVAGRNLQEHLDLTGPLDPQEVVRIGRQIAEGLAAAHAKGLVHRDIKPGNILLESRPDGGDPGTGKGCSYRVKITDFGLARAADDASITQSGVIAGTPLYMSPEQAQAETIDQRSDLFSLGSVLYVMCSGRPPFRAATSLAVLKRVTEDEPRPIREIIPEVPGGLAALISDLHAKNPGDRIASAREVVARLDRPDLFQPVGENTGSGSPVELISTADAAVAGVSRSIVRPTPHRRWAAAAAVLVALLAGLGFTEATGVTDLRGTVLRIISPEGTLVVEVDDPKISVAIDGEDLVFTGAGAREIRLKPGSYKLLATSNGKVVRRELVTVTRNGRQVIRVSREAAPVPAEPIPAAGPALPPAAVAPFEPRQAADHQGAWAKFLGLRVVQETPVGMKMTLIPPGTFLMGSLETKEIPNKDIPNKDYVAAREEIPQHPVELSRPFYLATREITQEQYERVLGRNPSAFAAKGVQAGGVEGIDTRTLPVERVTWFDAIEFCNRISEKEGLPPFYELKYPVRSDGAITAADVRELGGPGYRLPTEAEWEFACRAGTTTGYSFPFTFATLPQYGWFGYASKRPHSVGERKPNPFGLEDMHGNLFEWCSDWYAEYTSTPALDPRGPGKGTEKVARGGAYNYLPQYSRSAFRGFHPKPGSLYDNLGFRVARTIELPPGLNPDRLAAQWVLSLGGRIRIARNGKESWPKELPAGDFTLTGVNLEKNPKVTDTGLARLRPCRHLQVLYLQITGIGDAGMKEIAGLTSLRELYLWDTQVTDAGLKYLAGWPNLNLLYLNGTKTTDAGVRFLSGLTSLRNLSLQGTQITDAGLAHLKGLKDLDNLNLWGTRVSDAGLKHLYGSKALQRLDLRATGVAVGGVARLQQQLPMCRIDSSVYRGSWRIVGEVLEHPDKNRMAMILVGPPNLGDGDFTAEAMRAEGDHGLALVARATDIDHYYYFDIGVFKNQFHSLYAKESASNWRMLDQKRCLPVPNERWVKLRLKMRGSTFEAYVDDALVLQGQDDRRLKGHIGLRTWNEAGKFRNLKFTDPAGNVVWEGLPDLPKVSARKP